MGVGWVKWFWICVGFVYEGCCYEDVLVWVFFFFWFFWMSLGLWYVLCGCCDVVVWFFDVFDWIGNLCSVLFFDVGVILCYYDLYGYIVSVGCSGKCVFCLGLLYVFIFCLLDGIVMLDVIVWLMWWYVCWFMCGVVVVNMVYWFLLWDVDVFVCWVFLCRFGILFVGLVWVVLCNDLVFWVWSFVLDMWEIRLDWCSDFWIGLVCFFCNVWYVNEIWVWCVVWVYWLCLVWCCVWLVVCVCCDDGCVWWFCLWCCGFLVLLICNVDVWWMCWFFGCGLVCVWLLVCVVCVILLFGLCWIFWLVWFWLGLWCWVFSCFLWFVWWCSVWFVDRLVVFVLVWCWLMFELVVWKVCVLFCLCVFDWMNVG